MGPELTFYDSTPWSESLAFRPERLLRVSMDLNLLYAQRGDDIWMKATVKSLVAETASGLAVLQPLDAHLERSRVAGKTSTDVSASGVSLRLPLNVIRLMLRLSSDVAAALKFGSGPVAVRCTHFDRLWTLPAAGMPRQTALRARCDQPYILNRLRQGYGRSQQHLLLK